MDYFRPLNPKHHTASVTATVISLWGAMLGGAMGATVGLFGARPIMSLVFGFVFGFVGGVLVVSLLLALAYVVATSLSSDFEDAPIGCSTTSQLAGIMGGIGGALGAVMLALIEAPRPRSNTSTFFLCWTVTGFLPMVMVFVLVRIARLRTRNEE